MTEFTRSTALPHLEVRRSCRENTCYRPHTHDAFSVGLIEEGESLFAGQLGGSVILEPGDVIVIAADQVHQCNPHGSTWKYQMTHMDQSWATRLAPPGLTIALVDAVTVLRRCGLAGRVNAWNELIVADASAARIEDGFRSLVRELAGAAPEHSVVRPTADVDHLRPVLERLAEDEVNPSLDDLAMVVGMTRFNLVRAVKAATGLSPLAWRQNARVAKARHLLRAGRPIAQTATDLGFTDQSHFHRVFRAHVATSPGAYRA